MDISLIENSEKRIWPFTKSNQILLTISRSISKTKSILDSALSCQRRTIIATPVLIWSQRFPLSNWLISRRFTSRSSIMKLSINQAKEMTSWAQAIIFHKKCTQMATNPEWFKKENENRKIILFTIKYLTH